LFCTYVLYSSEFNRFYIGQCEDINSRLLCKNPKDRKP
jgi:hypothetical protein